METTEIHTPQEPPKTDFRLTLLKVGIGFVIVGGASYGLYKLYERQKKTSSEKEVLKRHLSKAAELSAFLANL